jgi:hypothetical protein
MVHCAECRPMNHLSASSLVVTVPFRFTLVNLIITLFCIIDRKSSSFNEVEIEFKLDVTVDITRVVGLGE